MPTILQYIYLLYSKKLEFYLAFFNNYTLFYTYAVLDFTMKEMKLMKKTSSCPSCSSW